MMMMCGSVHGKQNARAATLNLHKIDEALCRARVVIIQFNSVEALSAMRDEIIVFSVGCSSRRGVGRLLFGLILSGIE